MRLLLIVIPIILSIQSFGQDLNNFKSDMLKYSNQLTFLNEKQIAGSPYLNQHFISGVIIKTNGSEIKGIQLRYNTYSHTMQFKKHGTIFDIAEPTNIKLIMMGDKKFVYAPYNVARKIRLSYFQVLNEGRIQLLKMHYVIYKGKSGNTEVVDSSRFEPSMPRYYLRYNNGTANLVSSQKKLIKILQPIPKSIINYIKENDTNVNDEKELIDLVEHTNNFMD